MPIRGSEQIINIPACKLTQDDFNELHSILEQRAREAADRQIQLTPPKQDATDGEPDKMPTYIREWMRLSVLVKGDNGQWIRDPDTSELQKLPFSPTVIEFDSDFHMRQITKGDHRGGNNFLITLDFSTPAVIDFRDPSISAGDNVSRAVVFGENETWVQGTAKMIHEFFQNKRTSVGWLHNGPLFHLLQLTVGMAFAISCIFFIDLHFGSGRLSSASESVKVILYIGVFFVALNVFRITYNYARYVYPKIQGIFRKRGGYLRHQAFFYMILTSILSTIVGNIFNILQ